MSDIVAATRYFDASYPAWVFEPPVAAVLTSLSPSSTVPDTPTLITVTGTGFRPDSVVWADEEAQATTFISATELRYTALADMSGTQDITVHTQGLVSNSLTLTIMGA